MKKRVLSALLAVGMACSLAATAFATDLPGMATPESASYDLAEQDPAEDAASGEPAAVEAEPTPTPDAAEQPTPTPAPTADATAEPAPESEEEDAPVQTPVPLAPATAESAAAFDASQVMENGAKVTVQAAEGVLPAGARLETGMLTDADTLARLESALQEVGEYDGFLALDIGFTLEGEPVEPAGDVQVAIELPAGALAADADPDTLALVHFAEEGEALAAEVVDAAIEPQAEDDAAAASISLMALDAATAETAASDSPAVNLTFTIRSFSPFAVAWQAAAARIVDNETLRAHTVQGLTPFGTTINLFDYTMGQINQNNGRTRTFQFIDGTSLGGLQGVNNYRGEYETPNLDLVTRILPDNGYPRLDLHGENQSGENQSKTDSLDYLFDPTIQVAGKTSYSDVGGLLQVDSEGYYYYSSHENFAEFDTTAKNFILYDTWGVYKRGKSPDGQFFPFNTGNEVFTADGEGNLVPVDNNTFTKEDRNYHLGMTMSTRFVQQYGGHTDDTANAKAVTYKFSGDDDVWVYIDGVLVGDLGGIHDEATLEIDFSTGDVLVYVDGANGNHHRDGTYNGEGADKLAYRKTLRDLYQEADAVGRTSWNGNTFADETYHTLNFFYLERGAGDSNMSLRYNLVTIPETDIYKVDQDNEPVAGATFKLYLASDWKENGQSAKPICEAVTDANGSVVLLEKRDDGSQGYPLTLQRLYDTYGSKREDDGTLKLMLVETGTPDGYRDTGAIPLRLEKIGQSGRSVVVLLSDDPWTTGAYALPKTLVLAHRVQVNGRYLESNELDSGTMFAVVEKKVGNDWYPVTGAPISGWEVSDEPGIAGAIEAAQAQPQPNLFVLSTSGAYQVEINGLPGRIQDYQYLGGDGFRVSYYFSEAGSLANATTVNTYAVQNSDKFERQMSARLYIPNIVNRIAVQKVDSVTGNAVNGATIALYADDDVTKNLDGSVTLKEGAEPEATEVTKKLTMDEDSMDEDSINLNGGVVFDGLQTGTYWIKEIEVPDGYTINDNFVKVIVDGTGVYADAGEENDGIQVTRGVGRLVRSMLQFAVDDGIDVTLHNIVATLQNGKLGDDGWTWDNVLESPEGEPKQLHLKYSGQNRGDTLDYEPEVNDDGNPINSYSFTVDTGIPRLRVEQCQVHEPENSSDIKQDLTENGQPIDLTNLYTGTTVVHIADDPLANLKIEKKVEGLGEENRVPQDTNFTFTVKATDDTTKAKVQKYGALNADGEVTPGKYKIDGSQETVTFENGAATVTVTVKQGQNTASITILGLPVGQYTVTENTTDTSFPHDIGIYTFGDVTYSVSNSGNSADTNEDFTLQSPEKNGNALTILTTTVTATNKYKEGVRELLVKKTVEGDMGDTTQDFDFTLKLTKGEGDGQTVYKEDLTVAYDPVRQSDNGTPITTLTADKDGAYAFQLCHNQSIKITVPAGYTATVTETTTGQGYTVESRQYLTEETPEPGGILVLRPGFASGDKQKVAMNDDYTVEFRNTRDVVAPTGLESNHTKPYTLMVAAAGAAGLALVGAAVARYLRRRRQE